MKKLFIIFVALMFTTMIYSLNQIQNSTAAIEIDPLDQDDQNRTIETLIIFPEATTGIAEFSNVIIENIENSKIKLSTDPIAKCKTAWKWKDQITEIIGGSVLKMPSLTLVVNIDCEGYLSAGALKIPNHTISNSIKIAKNYEETG